MKRRPPKPVLVAVLAAQTISAVLAWRDLGRRSDDRVRGRKLLWRGLIMINPGNSAIYWLAGRRD